MDPFRPFSNRQEAMIQEFLRPEFRYKLRDALDGSEGDMVKQAPCLQNSENCPRCNLTIKFDWNEL